MAKAKPGKKAKARGKKLSVKKQPVKDLAARKGKDVTGGAFGGEIVDIVVPHTR